MRVKRDADTVLPREGKLAAKRSDGAASQRLKIASVLPPPHPSRGFAAIHLPLAGKDGRGASYANMMRTE